MPEPSFFFYDLETSGLQPERHRIMQFAGQRTTLNLEPVGEPVNLLVQLTDEVLPSPGAILITGITPQQTVRAGITEAELMQLLSRNVFTPGTCAVGFNNVRFDDPFIRYLHYRNFYDPYAWAYADGRSRWDLLDVMRLARALRPDGFHWPVDEAGRPVNKLAMLTAANGLEHTRAHDALSDVEALIAVARHLQAKQPKLFDYLFKLRQKSEVAKVVNLDAPSPFVYTSGRYGSEHHFTTVAYPIGAGEHGAVIVYDLYRDPADYDGLSTEQLAAGRYPTADQRAAAGFRPFPAKELKPGNCPAVATISTLDPASETRIGLTATTAQAHLAKLLAGDLPRRLREAMAARPAFEPRTDPDAMLYDGFINGPDKAELARVRATTDTAELARLQPRFTDPRLPELFLRYKARNFPDALSDNDRAQWEQYRHDRLNADLPAFAQELETAAHTADPAGQQLLADLKLWAESILPAD